MACITVAISACEGIWQVSESLAFHPDHQFHEGGDLFNDVPVSGGPDLAPGGH